MNSIHDMGGMHGFGPIELEEDEPPMVETPTTVVSMPRAVL